MVEGEGEGASDVCDQHVASPVGGESGQLLRHELDGLRADVETWCQQVWRIGHVCGCVSGCMWVCPWVSVGVSVGVRGCPWVCQWVYVGGVDWSVYVGVSVVVCRSGGLVSVCDCVSGCMRVDGWGGLASRGGGGLVSTRGWDGLVKSEWVGLVSTRGWDGLISRG